MKGTHFSKHVIATWIHFWVFMVTKTQDGSDSLTDFFGLYPLFIF